MQAAMLAKLLINSKIKFEICLDQFPKLLNPLYFTGGAFDTLYKNIEVKNLEICYHVLLQRDTYPMQAPKQNLP